MTASTIEIPLIIGGKEIRTGKTATSVMPHKHGHVLATYHLAGEEHASGHKECFGSQARLGKHAVGTPRVGL